jgi:hypothetical protein
MNALSEWCVYHKNGVLPINHQEDFCTFVVYAAEEMPLMLEVLRNYDKALDIALEAIDGLSDQQAMRDDSYLEDLRAIKKLTGKGEDVRTSR